MTVMAEIDERVPRIVGWEYETFPRIFQVDDQLIVFRCDQYVSTMPQCVARMPSGERCNADLLSCGHSTIQIVGTDASVEAALSPLPSDCFTRQRCPAHVYSGGEDAVKPAGEPFDPERHADALHHTVPRWSPKGIWTPAEHSSGQRLHIHHPATCPFGDHVPLALTRADMIEGEEYDPDDPVSRQVEERARAHWAAIIGNHLPDLAALLGPAEAPSADEADAEVIPAAPPPAAEPIIAEPEECPTGPTALYRYFDADDLLLYVGISDRLRSRTGSHIAGSSWMDFAVRSTIGRHPARAIALDAEESAIKAEHPLFNQQHNDTPEARRALVEYLIKHDRLDLLAPAVSRG